MFSDVNKVNSLLLKGFLFLKKNGGGGDLKCFKYTTNQMILDAKRFCFFLLKKFATAIFKTSFKKS